MDSKIQELTEKIYREGVEKGNEEAGRIVADAKEKEASMLREARTEADAIVEQAHREADELRKNTEAELRMYAAQAVEALKTEVADLVTDRVVRKEVKATTGDADFMRQMMLEIAREWAKNGEMTIQTSDADKLSAYFKAKAAELLQGGVRIEEVNGHKTSFAIAPADGSFKVQFGEAEFVEYFKEFLRPQLIEMLFSK